MHWTSSSIALTLSAAFLLFAPSANAQTLAPGEVARVADMPILKTEFDHWHDVWMRQGQAPTVSAARLRRLRTIIHLELVGVVLILLMAALMAKGIGLMI